MSRTLTPKEVAELAESGGIIGMTLRVTFTSGKNTAYPVLFHFTGYSYPYGDTIRYLDYILHNKNTEEYFTPKPFQFNCSEFAESWHRRYHYDYEEVGLIEVLDGMTFDTASDWEL